MLWIIIIPLILMAFYVVSIYNFFVSSKARIKASIQEIGNQLKRQAELIPNLVTSAKGYLKHEKGIFDKLTEARKTINSAEFIVFLASVNLSNIPFSCLR